MSKLLKREIKGFVVTSAADGCMLVEVFYRTKPIKRGATPVGIMTRLTIAAEIQRLLNKALK